jgi:hypothetical protein
MDIVNVTFRPNVGKMQGQVVELKQHDQVLEHLTRLEKATDDATRIEVAEALVELVQDATHYKVEQVLLESGTEYSEILFSEFRACGIATYVVEQL